MSANNDEFKAFKQHMLCSDGSCDLDTDHTTVYRGLSSIGSYDEGSWNPSKYHGTHWTTDPEVAKSFATSGSKGVLITAKVHNLFEMPRNSGEAVFSGVFAKDNWEKEMPVNGGSPVHIVSYQKYAQTGKKGHEVVEQQSFDPPMIGNA
jgi:hypothetical protein